MEQPILIYAESTPLDDRFKAHGLQRALNPICAGLIADHDGLLLLPFDGWRGAGCLRPSIGRKTHVINPIAAKLMQRLASRSPGLAGLALKLFISMMRSPVSQNTNERSLPTLLAVVGADPETLVRGQIVAERLGLRYTAYLVDDCFTLGPARRSQSNRMDIWISALRRCETVFTITSDLAKAVAERGSPLPIVLPLAYELSDWTPRQSEEGKIIHVGSVNELYEDALRDFISTACALPGKKYHVQLTSTGDGALRLKQEFPHIVELAPRESRAELLSDISAAEYALVVQSFSEDQSENVRKSFPSKILDYLEAANGIIAYAPPYGSSATYLKAAGIGAIASTQSELVQVMQSPRSLLGPLRNHLRENHSPESWREIVSSGISLSQ